MISRYLANPILSLEGLKLRYFVMVSFGMVEIGILERMTIKAIVSFWHSKIERNIERDKEVNEELRKQGWKVFRFWETEITVNPDVCLNEVLNYMNRKSTTDEKIAITKNVWRRKNIDANVRTSFVK